MTNALRCGLQLDDFEHLTVGMIIDVVTIYAGNDEEKETVIQANQQHFDSF